MDSQLDTYIETLEKERNNSARTLEAMTKHLRLLRLNAEQKRAQLQRLQGDVEDKRSGLDVDVDVDLALIDEMEDILNEKTITVLRTAKLVRKLKSTAQLRVELNKEIAANVKIMTQWKELVEYFDSNDDYGRKSCPRVAPGPQTMDLTLGDEKARDKGRESCSTDKAKSVVAEDEEPKGPPPDGLAGSELAPQVPAIAGSFRESPECLVQ